ncbi:MAG: RHS repeat protein, partial [Nitrospirae bacterium]|nr:RHS repeat protein [Nitrospirota bacterium]
MLSFIPSPGSAKDMTYDDNGKMMSVTNGCGTSTYSWDARNRLTAITGFMPDCSALTASFKYDPLGSRIEKTINGRTIKYLYDGMELVQEMENNAVTVNYLRTMNIDEPLARIKSDGTIRYYQLDALGSVIALTDENGAVKTTYSYDP